MMERPAQPEPVASAAEWSAYANAMSKYTDWVAANPGAANEAPKGDESSKAPSSPAAPPPRKPAA